MIFGKVERRRTERTSSESLTKRAKIVAFWRVLTQSPVARRWGSCGWRNYLKLIFVFLNIFTVMLNGALEKSKHPGTLAPHKPSHLRETRFFFGFSYRRSWRATARLMRTASIICVSLVRLTARSFVSRTSKRSQDDVINIFSAIRLSKKLSHYSNATAP